MEEGNESTSIPVSPKQSDQDHEDENIPRSPKQGDQDNENKPFPLSPKHSDQDNEIKEFVVSPKQGDQDNGPIVVVLPNQSDQDKDDEEERDQVNIDDQLDNDNHQHDQYLHHHHHRVRLVSDATDLELHSIRIPSLDAFPSHGILIKYTDSTSSSAGSFQPFGSTETFNHLEPQMPLDPQRPSYNLRRRLNEAISSYVENIIEEAMRRRVAETIVVRTLMVRPAPFETYIRPDRYRPIPPLDRLPSQPPGRTYHCQRLVTDGSRETMPEKPGWPSQYTDPLSLNNHSASILRKLYNSAE